MARDISKLHPELQEKLKQLQKACEKKGLKIGIGECVRSVAEQDALYAQGRTKPGKIVTNAKGSTYQSMHQWGVAFDFWRNDNKGAYYDADGFFAKVGKIGQSIGLEWGGSWKFKDKPHFQLPDWGSTPSKLKAQYKTPANFKKTWEVTVKAKLKDDVNVRDSNAKKIGTLPKDKTVSVVKKEAKTMIINGNTRAMAKIKYNGGYAYIVARFLKYL